MVYIPEKEVFIGRHIPGRHEFEVKLVIGFNILSVVLQLNRPLSSL